MICFTCNKEIEMHDKMYFCPYCVTQLVCKGCNEPLLNNANGCSFCGKEILLKQNRQDKLNEIEFEQKGDSKKFKATFSDNVGHDLVGTFGGLFGITAPKKRILGASQTSSNFNFQVQNLDDGIEDANEIEEDDFMELINSVLKVDGESLVFQTVNFKTQTSLNKEIRIALLTLLGYKFLHNAEEIKRTKLTEALKKFKLNSGNFRTWITKSEEIGQKSGGMIFLTPNGLKTAFEILKEVTNSNVTESALNFVKSKGKKKKSTGEDGDEIKKTSGKSPKEFVLKLLAENFFDNKRNSSDIIKHLRVNHAAIFSTGQISTVLGRFIGTKILKREKGEKGNYVYFI